MAQSTSTILKWSFFIALLLTLAGCATTPSSQDQPLGVAVQELFGNLGSERPVRVAVLPLTDVQTEIADELGIYIADDIVYHISSRLPGRAQVVERERIAELLQEMELNNLSGIISESDAKRVGKMSGADVLLIGTKLEMATAVQVRMRLVAVEAGEVLGASRATLPLSAEYLSVRRTTESSTAPGNNQAQNSPVSETVPAVPRDTSEPVSPSPLELNLQLAALAHIPINEYVSPGFSSRLGVYFPIPKLPVYADGLIGYSRAMTSGLTDDGPLSTFSLGVGGGLSTLELLPFELRGGGRLGYALATLQTENTTGNSGSFFWSAGLAAEFNLGPRMGLTVEAGVSTQLATYLAFEAGLGLVYRLPLGTSRTRPIGAAPNQSQTPSPSQSPLVQTSEPRVSVTRTIEYTRDQLQLVDAGFGLVFPVFYRYYNDAPIGQGTLRNTGTDRVENLEVRVNIPRFMDLPQRQRVSAVLLPGEEQSFSFQVLFNDGLLGVTEGTQVAAEISVSYNRNGQPVSYSVNTVLDVANRNAMTWDDDRKAAAFVTARDPSLLAYARTVASIGRTDERRSVNDQLRSAIALLSAFRASGLNYIIDPVTPHADRSNSGALDFLLFPVQTFQYGGGDCDDLSIAYAAALESLGIESAFITTPGHIFVAFNTGVSESEYPGISPDVSRLIFHKGKVWIPVDVTLLNRGFLQAWREGIRLWQEHAPAGRAELIPIREAWQVYEPIGLDRELRQSIPIPDQGSIDEFYTQELDRYIQEMVDQEEALLLERIDRLGPSTRLYNRLGTLFARFGLYDDARFWFNEAITFAPDYQPLLNLGNIAFLLRDYPEAADWYEQAEKYAPTNLYVSLAIAILDYETGDWESAAQRYQGIVTEDPETAARYSYLGGGTNQVGRASEANTRTKDLFWAEEE